MDFEFDPAKAAGNLRKHGVSFSDAEGVFMDPLAQHRVDPDSAGEARFVAVGTGSAGAVLVVSYTIRADAVRLISVRRASRGERRSYES
jgi:uncharacterized DUF497 family protein